MHNNIRQLLTGTWTFVKSTYPQVHPNDSYLHFHTSLEKHLTIHIDACNDPIRCQIHLHGGIIEGECRHEDIRMHHGDPSEDRPWGFRWKPIHLRRPPWPHGGHVKQMMRMLPLIYSLQKEGLRTEMIRILPGPIDDTLPALHPPPGILHPQLTLTTPRLGSQEGEVRHYRFTLEKTDDKNDVKD